MRSGDKNSISNIIAVVIIGVFLRTLSPAGLDIDLNRFIHEFSKNNFGSLKFPVNSLDEGKEWPPPFFSD